MNATQSESVGLKKFCFLMGNINICYYTEMGNSLCCVRLYSRSFQNHHVSCKIFFFQNLKICPSWQILTCHRTANRFF